jgi:hypothetical protein
MKKIINSIKVSMLTAAILAVSFPAFAYASTYAYVSQSGQMNTVVADTPERAILTAPDIAIHSGVILVNSSTGVVLGANFSTTYNTKTYAYVNHAGTVMAISAGSSADAFAKALDISNNSGVILLSNTSGNDGVVGNHVSGI